VTGGGRGDLLRTLAIAAAAILLVGAAAIAFILTAGSRTPRLDGPAPESGAPPAAPPVVAPLPPLPPPAPDSPLARPEPGSRVEPGPPPLPPELDRWEAVPVATRTDRMGLIGPILASELSILRPRLEACVDDDRQVRPAQAPPPQAPEPGSPDEGTPTLLVLNLELEAGRIRIEDAPVEAQGRASEGAIACAQQVLRGHIIPAPVVTGPGRARMALSLGR
jgi:hypothetical protein